MKKICSISIMFWMVLIITGCDDVTHTRSLKVPVEIGTNYETNIEIAKKVAQDVNIDLKERVLLNFPSVPKEKLNSLSLLYGYTVHNLKTTVHVEIEIEWKGEFNEAKSIIEFCASEVTKALKNP